MTAIVWGKTGERYFDAGVDRGVLYADGERAVPWNGLTAVKESPTGGEPRPFYIDGFKYINLSAAEEFAATIEAFAAPREFMRCDGTAAISNGLFVTQQPRTHFGFTYRTQVGNDLEGLDLGYKIHLVYNALAAPSSRDNKTLSQQTDPNLLSWDITTAPPPINNLRPSAHFVVDTRELLPDNWRWLGDFENMLYGSAENDPYLPTPQEVIDLFYSWDG